LNIREKHPRLNEVGRCFWRYESENDDGDIIMQGELLLRREQISRCSKM
jgi:hypothetical protein